MEMKKRRAWSIAEVCELYGWSKAYFYRLLKAGKAPRTVKIGRRRIILAEDLEQWEGSLC